MKNHNKFLILLGIYFLNTLGVYSQESFARIEISDRGIAESVTFKNSLSGEATSFNILDYNPYRELNLQKEPSIRAGLNIVYSLEGIATNEVLNRFFPTNRLAFDNAKNINFRKADVSIYAEITERHVVVIYNLLFYDPESLIGKNSTIIIMDEHGRVVSNLPESREGYYSPAITMDGKYVGIISGDISTEAVFTLFDGPQLKIYEVESGLEVFSMPRGSFSLYRPITFENMILIVLGKQYRVYEYNFILPESRIIFKKEFSSDEVGMLVRYDKEGMVFKGSNGNESLCSYMKDFIRISY